MASEFEHRVCKLRKILSKIGRLLVEEKDELDK